MPTISKAILLTIVLQNSGFLSPHDAYHANRLPEANAGEVPIVQVPVPVHILPVPVPMSMPYEFR
jgi:hypothetical protein